MAPKNQASKAEQLAQYFPSRFKPIVQTIDRKTLNRDPEGALVYPTGFARFNTAGTEKGRLQASLNFPDLTKCGILWAADEETGEIAGCFVPPTVPGVTPIREYKDGYIGGSLLGVFTKNPDLAPDTRKWVSVTFHQEQGEPPHFILHMNIALPHAKRRRKESAKKKKEDQKTPPQPDGKGPAGKDEAPEQAEE